MEPMCAKVNLSSSTITKPKPAWPGSQVPCPDLAHRTYLGSLGAFLLVLIPVHRTQIKVSSYLCIPMFRRLTKLWVQRHLG